MRQQIFLYIFSAVLIIGTNMLSYKVSKKVLESEFESHRSRTEVLIKNIEREILEDSYIMNVELQNKINESNSSIKKLLENDFYNNVCVKEDLKNAINKKIKDANNKK